MRAAWQEVRTPAARYAEAMLLMQEKRFLEAMALITALPVEHELKTYGTVERARMLAYMQILAGALADDRAEHELTAAEVAQLGQLAANGSDRPTTWINNLLCRYYDQCTAPFTGGGGSSTPKARRSTALGQADPANLLSLRPNPANTWVAVDHLLAEAPDRAMLELADALGRIRASRPLSGLRGQTVLDLQGLEPGLYTVHLISSGLILDTLKLVVQ